MSILWFAFMIYCALNGAEITDMNLLMISIFYVGDCILLKTIGKEKSNEK